MKSRDALQLVLPTRLSTCNHNTIRELRYVTDRSLLVVFLIIPLVYKFQHDTANSILLLQNKMKILYNCEGTVPCRIALTL
jgi:hypothetical protein